MHNSSELKMLPSAIALPALKAVVMEWSLLQLLLALATLPLLLCLSCYIYMMWPVWTVRHIPCPPYRLGLGHLPLLIAEESECFMRLAKEYGPVYRFHFTRQPIVMVADAELCRQLSIKNFKMARDRAKPASILTVPFMHRGLFFSRGQTWSSMRNIELPFYHSDRMRKYVSVMCAVADTLVKRLSTIEAGEDVNISDFLPMLTLDVIGETAFGAHFQTLQSSKATQSGNKNADPKKYRTAELDRKLQVAAYEWQNNMRLDGAGALSTTVGLLFPSIQLPLHKLLSSIPGTSDWHLKQQVQTMMGALTEVLQHRKSNLNLDDRIDMLSLLLDAAKSSALLSDDYINALTFEMLLAGSETTAVTLSTCIYLISCHPHVEQKVIREIDSFGPLPDVLSYEDLQRFPYIEQVFKETLRYYSTSPVIARYIDEDMNLGGYHLKKGTHVWMLTNAIMRDPAHFKDPEVFRPERFDEDCLENKERHPCAFMPFGLGPRACIGSRFSTQEAKIVLIKLYSNFTFTHSPAMEKPLEFVFGMIRRPKYGVRVRVHCRQSKPSA